MMVHDLRMLQVCGAYRRVGVTLNDEALKEEWFSIDRTKRRLDESIEDLARQLFLDQRDDLVSRAAIADALKSADGSIIGARREIKASAIRIGIATPTPSDFDVVGWMRQTKGAPLIVSKLFRLDYWKTVTEKLFRPAFPPVIEEGFDAGMLRIGVEGTTFSVDTDAAQATMRAMVENVKGINDETARLFIKLVDNWLDADTDTDDLAARIASTFNQYSVGRSGRIARTTTAGLFEAGQLQAFDEADVDAKRWLSRRDGNVRTREKGKYDHLIADGEEVSLDKPFVMTGGPLMHPADPNGAAANSVECRCTLLPVIKVEEDE